MPVCRYALSCFQVMCYNRCVMRKSIYKIITVAAICFVTAVCIFTGADIIKSRQLSIDRAQESLGYMGENCADEFRAIFDNGESSVTSLAAVAEETIIVDELLLDDIYYGIRIGELKKIAYQITANSKYPISLYITFNPEYFREDIWYVKGLDGEVINASAEGAELDAWLEELRVNEEIESFYNITVENGDMWFETFYDEEMDWEVVSRTTAVYDKKGTLIGIVGADIYIGDITGKLKSIDEITGGKSAVVNSNGQLIAGSPISTGEPNSSNNIHAVSEIGNVWEITLLQPINVATKATARMIIVTIIMAVTLMIAIFVVIYFVYQKHGKSIINEFEEKDLLMINQARQAQMGESVGNIAHQLKQPLNGVNMALSNLKDEYSSDVSSKEEFERRVDRIKLRIGNMSETIDDLMMFLKPQKEPQDFSVIKTINNVIFMMEERIKLYSISVDVTGEDFQIYGYTNEFAQCVFNIIDNAVYEITKNDHDRKINITVSKGLIKIENSGSHIVAKSLEHLFELYFTTKGNEGTGIGLYLTKTILETHFEGTISGRNTDNGVCFEICIPCNECRSVTNAE